jgi:hypothetical protein
MIRLFREMDEPDAIRPAKELFDAIAKSEYEKRGGRPGLSITHTPTVIQVAEFKCDNFPSGMYLWRGNRLIAQFTVVRDDWNWSVCVFVDLRDQYDERLCVDVCGR